MRVYSLNDLISNVLDKDNFTFIDKIKRISKRILECATEEESLNIFDEEFDKIRKEIE